MCGRGAGFRSGSTMQRAPSFEGLGGAWDTTTSPEDVPAQSHAKYNAGNGTRYATSQLRHSAGCFLCKRAPGRGGGGQFGNHSIVFVCLVHLSLFVSSQGFGMPATSSSRMLTKIHVAVIGLQRHQVSTFTGGVPVRRGTDNVMRTPKALGVTFIAATFAAASAAGGIWGASSRNYLRRGNPAPLNVQLVQAGNSLVGLISCVERLPFVIWYKLAHALAFTPCVNCDRCLSRTCKMDLCYRRGVEVTSRVAAEGDQRGVAASSLKLCLSFVVPLFRRASVSI